jgi:hypothetical protein
VGRGALQPRRASITAVNEITVEAAARAVWALLADASRWPHWCAACRWVHSSAPGATCRRPFDWNAQPVCLHSVVTEPVPRRAATARFLASAVTGEDNGTKVNRSGEHHAGRADDG